MEPELKQFTVVRHNDKHRCSAALRLVPGEGFVVTVAMCHPKDAALWTHRKGHLRVLGRMNASRTAVWHRGGHWRVIEEDMRPEVEHLSRCRLRLPFDVSKMTPTDVKIVRDGFVRWMDMTPSGLGTIDEPHLRVARLADGLVIEIWRNFREAGRGDLLVPCPPSQGERFEAGLKKFSAAEQVGVGDELDIEIRRPDVS